jgi:signal transduction histidine kinase
VPLLIRFPQANLRVIVMLASLVVIVGAGYLVRQRVADDTVVAFRLVSHTHEVRAALHELNAALSELQAAAFSAKLNGKDVAASERYTEARALITPLVDSLRDLTQDNSAQQESIGSLRARIEERVDLFDRSMQDTATLKSAELSTAISRIPVEDISKAILDREQSLADSRQLEADRRVAFARWVTAATALAQVLLLGAVVWISDRQLQRRIAAESETRQAIGRARLIVETVREPIAVITADLRVLQANQAFFEFYGLSQPFTGTLGDVPAWSDSALRQRLKDVVATRRELWDYEIRQQAGGDTARHVIVNARPMKLPDSGDVTALVTVSDMTVRKRAEEQVLELNRQLSGKIEQVSEVNRELEAFSYSVSHDLRAPLRHIAGFSDKLHTQLVEQGDAKLQHYCEVIADSARRMSALIEDLLSYSRLGRHAIRLHTVDMQSLVDESRSTLLSSLENRRIEWRIAPLPIVIADAAMLRLVWQNLLDNAIKYSAGKDPAVIEIGVDDTPTERVFWVRDNGAGFDMKYVDKLFGVFQRLHKASAFQGTGIGLASVRRIVARHGGRTWAEGTPEQGATIYFSLPRHEPIA